MFLYLIDNCNVAGFIELDYDLFSFQLGLETKRIETAIKGLNRLLKKGDWLWIPNFAKHQKNLPLNPLNNAHKSIIGIIKSHPEFEEAQVLLPEFDNLVKVSLTAKESVWIRDKGTCQYTGIKIKELADYELDHIIPRSKNGADAYDNYATCLKSFNREKSDKNITVAVPNYSASLAKRELLKNPLLLAEFNIFFKRHIVVHGGSLVDNANGYLGAKISPIGKGKGKGKGNDKGKGRRAELFEKWGDKFEIARKAYLGRKNGLEKEWENFANKFHEKIEVIDLMLPAIQNQITWRKQSEAKGAMVPQWKDFQTWINSRCWKEEPAVDFGTQPKGNSTTQTYDPNSVKENIDT